MVPTDEAWSQTYTSDSHSHQQQVLDLEWTMLPSISPVPRHVWDDNSPGASFVVLEWHSGPIKHHLFRALVKNLQPSGSSGQGCLSQCPDKSPAAPSLCMDLGATRPAISPKRGEHGRHVDFRCRIGCRQLLGPNLDSFFSIAIWLIRSEAGTIRGPNRP